MAKKYTLFVPLKYLFFLILFFGSTEIKSQIKVPKGFKLIKGDSPVGRDDFYKYKKYTLAEDLTFQGDGGCEGITKQEFIKYLSEAFGISFKITKDGLFYGSGYSNSDKIFYYIVFVKSVCTSFVLSSEYNNADFSKYSTWLINSIRNAIKDKKEIYFTPNL